MNQGAAVRWNGDGGHAVVRAVRSIGGTLTLAALALVVFALDLGASLQLRLDGALDQPWRLLTGHLTHWSGDHLAWDLVMFVALGAILEPRGRVRMLSCTAVSALSISAAILLTWTGIDSYRGLSGVDSALFVLAIGLLVRDAVDENRCGMALLYGVALAGFAAKVVWEAATGSTLFVEANEFTVVPLAHLVGGVVGGAFAVLGPSVRPLAGDLSRPGA